MTYIRQCKLRKERERKNTDENMERLSQHKLYYLSSVDKRSHRLLILKNLIKMFSFRIKAILKILPPNED